MDKEQAIDLLDNLIGMIEDNQDNDYDTAFRMAIEALKAQHSQEGTTSALNNQVNLCDSCTYTYPECPSEKDGVIFGNGIGNDNICACNKYQPTVQPEPGKWITETDEHGNTRGRCTKCGMVQYAGCTNFCPDCGTKMATRPQAKRLLLYCIVSS